LKKILITTSWDDGHPLDFKIALLLYKYAIKTTFYIALKNKERVCIKKNNINKISQMGFEIGSHSFTHPVLTIFNHKELLYEIKQSKKELEKIIKNPVVSFCYPKGKFSKNISVFLKKEGYCLARTTSLFHTRSKFKPFFMPTTVHFSNRSYLSYIKQGLRELNFRGFYNWSFYGFHKNPLKLSLKILNNLSKTGGYFHLWGHSWEIEQQNLWADLEKLFETISKKKNIICLTNYEIIKYLKL